MNRDQDNEQVFLCPSAPCGQGTKLIGIVGSDGQVGYITPPIPLTNEFVQTAQLAEDTGRRFRFSGPCVERGCAQWTGSRCGIIDQILEANPETGKDRLPPCGI